MQTFTVRKVQKKSITEAYLPIIELGIKSFEVARIDFNEANAREIRELVDKYGINISAIQVKPKKVFENQREIIDFAKTVGCKNVVISMLPFECILGREEKFFAFTDSLDTLFDSYSKEGITLAYHHHNWEYIKLSTGRTRMAELLARTKKIKFVNDTYWTARSGVDPGRQIREFSDRLLGIHLRDLGFRKRFLDVLPHDTYIGGGVIDFRRVLTAAEAVGCEYLVIEQKTDEPYLNIKKSYEHLCSIDSSKE